MASSPKWSWSQGVLVGNQFALPVRTMRGLETHVHPMPWSPEYKDWGFDEIYPAPTSPFEQVEIWDRAHRGRWIEPQPSALVAFSNIMKESYVSMLRRELNRQVLPLWSSGYTRTPGEQMLIDMQRYSATVPHRRLIRSLKNFKRDWRTQLAFKLAPQLQEDLSW